MSALPIASSVDISNALQADSISVGYVKNNDGEFEFIGSLISELEQHFNVSFGDRLGFFTPTGKAGELFEIPVSSPIDFPDAKTERIFLVGVGDQSPTALRAAGAAIGRKVRGKNTTVYSTISQEKDHAISMSLGAWLWNMKSDKKKDSPTIQIATQDKKTIEAASVIAKAVCRARDLVHTPANIKTPAWMAKQVEEFAKGTGLKVQILSGLQLKDFGGLRAVGGSSPKPGPRMIQVSYSPKRAVKSVRALPHVVLVGKGITFDTGGISLKRPYDTMMAMKSDMAGSAAVFATLTALVDLQPMVRVTALMMMAENAFSGTAQRPSDVISISEALLSKFLIPMPKVG